jgi:microcompartment protein CcmK/EutM
MKARVWKYDMAADAVGAGVASLVLILTKGL